MFEFSKIFIFCFHMHDSGYSYEHIGIIVMMIPMKYRQDLVKLKYFT
jgi:hypothetical protein